ncbi:MAG: hypothetical protein FJ411_03810 [Verrucomicrobia bacterium]|nr:hypothetical protein [Verrucomicrobiota bacterium]
MKTLRILLLLFLGIGIGVGVAPFLPNLQAKLAGNLAKVLNREERKAGAQESAPARPAAVPAPKPVSPLRPGEAAEIAKLVGSDPAAAEANPAAMTRTLDQSAGRMAIGGGTKLASPDRPWVAELLPGPIAYWRVRTMGATLAEAIGRDWAAWRQKNPLGAVLDLRECLPAQSLEAAAELCALFVTPGEVLFSWRDGAGKEKVFRSDRQPLGLNPVTPLVVLVGPSLRGAGELVATILQERAGAILLGQATAGQTGWLAESRLSTGRSLFRLRGEILLPGGRAGAGRPLPPDVVLNGANYPDVEIWTGGEMTIASTIAEVPPIKRTREATLLNEDEGGGGETMSLSLPEKDLKDKRPPQDRGLQRAGDLLRALRKMPPSRQA